MLPIWDIFGSAGLLLLLIAFYKSETKKWDTDSLKYNILNLLGATVLLIYAYRIESIVFMILEIIWMSVALYGIIRTL